MNNEQGKEYLIAEGVLHPRARKRKRVRQYGYVAECWHRHLINLESALQSIERLSAHIEVATISHEARIERTGRREQWETLLTKTGELSEAEKGEIEGIVAEVYAK